MWIAAMPRAKGVFLSSMAALYLCIIQGAGGATFEVVNNCTFTVWAAASPSGGKRLGSGQSWTLQVPAGTSSTGVRFWGRTGCSFNSSGRGICSTGDCGGLLNCQGSGTLATLFEYTLNGDNNDFYDISLVDGFNLPMSIIPSNSSCAAVACSRNITAVCPAKLKVTDGCKGACAASDCPNNYSALFKAQCPQAYTYSMDSSSSTFTCPGGSDYTVVFCGGTTATASPATKNLTAPPGNLTVPSTNSTAPSGSTNLTVPSTNLTAPPGNLTRSSGKTSSKILPVLLGSAGGIVLIVVLCLVFGRRRHWKNCFRTDANLAARGDFGQVLFDYKVLRDSTANFDRNNMLGKGGFGEVYKGRLPDGRVVAVKKLNGKQTSQAAEEFLTEVKLITSVRHRNLVRLLGCCTRGHKRLLVYEFMPNNSLDKHLFGGIRNALSWENRLNIIVGTARGLAYLHGDSNVRIIHRDIKCANILLDDRLHPKIADFGLAKFFPEGQTHVSTRVGGTIGYTAPEYAVHGQLTEKADVYSYGIVVLEIVSGRKCVDARLPAPLQLLLEWAWNLFQQDQVLDIVDSSLNGQYPREQALRVISIALLCTQGSWALRPAMSEVVSMLTNSSEIIAEPTRPAFIDAPADRPANITPIPDSRTFAAAPSQRSHGSISVSLLPR